MIEKAAPFVIADDQERVRPRGTIDDRFVYAVQESFAIADIGVRMVVA
jgi:hypothetical protein